MTRISDLNRVQDLTDGDVFPIGTEDGLTRGVTAKDAAKYFTSEIGPIVDEAKQAALDAQQSAEAAAESAAAADGAVDVLREDIKQFSGELTGTAEETPVPSHSNPDMGPALNAQAQALLNRQEQFKLDLASSGGAGLVGGVPVPAADSRFAGGFDTAATDNKGAVKSALDSGETVRVQRGIYTMTGPVATNSGNRVSLEGEGADSTILKISGNGSMLSVSQAVSAAIRRMQFDMTQPATVATTHGLIFVNQQALHVEDVQVIGLAGTGTAIIAYSTDGVQIPYAVIGGVRVRGDRVNSTNTNGVLLVDHIYAVLDSIDASGMAAFAIELKNLSEYNRISNTIARLSNAGLYYGSDVVGRYPSYNAASNHIARGCDGGYVPGFGAYNVLSGYVCDTEGALSATPEGVRYDGHDNLTIGMSFKAEISGHAARYQGTAYNNSTSVKFSSGGGAYNRAVVLASGARRNATEIIHPGTELTSIDTIIENSSGKPMSGVDSNPIWSHATGEYYGSLSNGWRWIHDKSPGVRQSSHKWRYDGIGDSYLSISTDGTGVSGLNINSPTGNRNISYNEPGGYWSVDGVGFGVRMYSSTLRPTTDNTMDFGTATFRGRTAYFGTGAINTSDAREKSAPEGITDLMMDAADYIEIVLFQWLDAIKAKGEDEARWHFGPIAQQVRDAFAAHGLDGTRYGLLCYDKWENEYESVFEEHVGALGTTATLYTGERLIVSAGDRWGIRPDQCLWLLAAAARRRAQRAESRLDAIEKRLSTLSGL